MKECYLDIETIPNAEVIKRRIESLPPPEDLQPPSNYRSAETIARWQADKRLQIELDLWDKAALSPFTGMVAAVAVVCVDPEIPDSVFMASPGFNPEAELKMLEMLAKHLDEFDRVVGFNIREFDAPFLRARMWHYNTRVPMCLAQETKYPRNIRDVRDRLTGFQYMGKGTLVEWCELLHAPRPIPHDHTLIHDLCTEDSESSRDELLNIVLQDVLSTKELDVRTSAWRTEDASGH